MRMLCLTSGLGSLFMEIHQSVLGVRIRGRRDKFGKLLSIIRNFPPGIQYRLASLLQGLENTVVAGLPERNGIPRGAVLYRVIFAVKLGSELNAIGSQETNTVLAIWFDPYSGRLGLAPVNSQVPMCGLSELKGPPTRLSTVVLGSLLAPDASLCTVAVIV